MDPLGILWLGDAADRDAAAGPERTEETKAIGGATEVRQYLCARVELLWLLCMLASLQATETQRLDLRGDQSHRGRY